MLRWRGAIFSALFLAWTLTGVAVGQSSADAVGIDIVHPVESTEAPAKPRIDQVFQSMSDSARADSGIRATPLLLAGVSIALMSVAISQWKKHRAARPKPVGDHRKLLDEIARASGLSRRQLKRLEASARAGGMSSPLVAAICPSVLLKRAAAARSGTEKSQWASLSRQVAGRR